MSLEEDCRKASQAADQLYAEFTEKLAKQKTPANIYQLAVKTRATLNDSSRGSSFRTLNNKANGLTFFQGTSAGGITSGGIAVSVATTTLDIIMSAGFVTLIGGLITAIPLIVYADNSRRPSVPKFIPLTQSQRLLFSTVQRLQKIDRILVKTMIDAQKADPQGIFALHQQLPTEQAAQTPAKLSRIFKGQLMKDFKAAKTAIVPPPMPDVLKPQPPSILAELDRPSP